MRVKQEAWEVMKEEQETDQECPVGCVEALAFYRKPLGASEATIPVQASNYKSQTLEVCKNPGRQVQSRGGGLAPWAAALKQ